MNCPKCNNPGVLNTVLNKDFYYCRVCKEEIILTVVSTPTNLLKPLSMIKQLAPQKIQTFHNSILTVPIIIHTPVYSFVTVTQATGTVPNIGKWLIPSDLDLELKDWLPALAPAQNDMFCGIDRSLDVERLAGIRYDAKSSPVGTVDRLLNMVRFINREGGHPDCIILPKAKYKEVESELGGLAQNVMFTPTHSTTSFPGLKLSGVHGPVIVLVDETIDLDKGYAVKLDTWQYDKVLTCNNLSGNGVILF